MPTLESHPVALVTGASRGIGRAIVERLRSAGWRTASLSRRPRTAATGDDLPLAVDLTQFDANAVVATTISRFGRLDAVVNNAGFGGPYEPFSDATDATWSTVRQTNLDAAVSLCRAAWLDLVVHGRGRIVNIGSVYSFASNPGSAHYAIAKHAIVGLTRALAVEAGERLTVNCVCPGYTDTDMTAGLPADLRASIISRIPAARFGKPNDVAAVVAFLLSDAAAYVNGSVITIDGGLSARVP